MPGGLGVGPEDSDDEDDGRREGETTYAGGERRQVTLVQVAKLG